MGIPLLRSIEGSIIFAALSSVSQACMKATGGKGSQKEKEYGEGIMEGNILEGS